MPDHISPLADRFVPSPNHDARTGAVIDTIILHYTGMPTASEALQRLCDPDAKVSSHYLVHEDGAIIQLVDESRRAWHAGVSCWNGMTDLNSRSLGIEIVNPGHDGGCPDFPEPQIGAVIRLCRDIHLRWPIRPDQVLAHSDVAPERKRDPGEKFPWADLAAAAIGVWVAPEPLDDEPQAIDAAARAEFLNGLAAYGYRVEASGADDDNTCDVIAAFQRHFRPARVDGIADRSSVVTLGRLRKAQEQLRQGGR